MAANFEVTWDEVVGAPQQDVWDAITARSAGWLWDVEYEPRVGGAERGLTDVGGTVTQWEPPQRFATQADYEVGGNELVYELEPNDSGTRVTYRHRFTSTGDDPAVHAQAIDSCRRHTVFYQHSMAEYATHFAGRAAVYATADAAGATFATVLAALWLPDDAVAGDRVLLTPRELPPIDGIVDYRADVFLGIRSADALLRVYGRDVWGMGVQIAHHLFAEGVDRVAVERDWSCWLTRVCETEKVA
jgi:hypothetical protein